MTPLAFVLLPFVLAFVYERDMAFVVITTVVLIVLLLSFYLGKVEG
jgi:uncharacterized membrane protein